LRPVTVERLGEGWDDLVLRVNDEWAFHFPRRQVGADLVSAEVTLLGQLPHLGLDIPRPRFVGASPDEFGWPIVGYQCIDGHTWCRANLTLDERTSNASRLGQFLRELHACDITSEIETSVPLDQWRRLDVRYRRVQALNYLERALDAGLLDDGHVISEYLDRETDALRSPREDTLVHGDLYSRHLIVDERHSVVGIIDWGDAHRGDRAIDLAVAHLVLPASAHENFRGAYGNVSESTWQLARFRAVQHALVTLVYGHKTQDAAMQRESAAALAMIFDPGSSDVR
jgi:aminoglycoside phosphotransferase (APT) family kinase protein